MITDESTSDGRISHSDKNAYSDKQEESFKQEFFATRFNLLTNAFKEMHLNMNDCVYESELLRLLDSRCPISFDRDIAYGLFSKIPKQDQLLGQSFFEIRDFVHTYIKAEYLLLIKTDEINQKLKQIAQQKKALENQILASDSENSNQETRASKDKEYNLNLEILEVISEGTRRIYSPKNRYTAVVKYDGYKYETLETANDGLEFNPRFHHTFHLKLHTLRDRIVVSFRKYGEWKNTIKYDESEAEFGFEAGWVNKSRMEMWVDLYDQHTIFTQEKMLIAFELESDQALGMKHLDAHMKELRGIEKRLLREKELISSSLKDLIEPFSIEKKGHDLRSRRKINHQINIVTIWNN